MNNKRVRTKAMAMAVAAAMAVELCPVTAFAVTGDQVAADGTYTSTAQVNRTAQDDEDENEWYPYGVSVSLTVKDGKFEDITVTPDASYSEKDNKSYFDKAYSKSKGIKTKLEGQPATEDTIKNWDAVSTATRTSTAVKQAALEAMQSASEKQDPTPVEVNTDALQTSITTAEGKNQADYTEASWAALTEKLTAAKAALEAKESQEAVDAAQTALDAAVAALEAKPSEPEKPDVTTGTYVLMNIPYDQFYAADVNNSVKVDAFTSATKNKVRTAGLAGGSYHVDNTGNEITGVTFPVKVGEGVDLSKYKQITDESSVDITVTNRGQTSTATYTGKDALFESASYSYYTLSETPKYYKEVTLNADGSLSFGKTQGTAQKVSGVTPELTTQTSYGDYQLNLDGLENTISQSGTQVYGVIISTKEGNDYGMRHLENIWRVTELAWCTGFTSAVHNCPTSSAHYVNMMGQHINKVTYYTSQGIYEIPVDNLYVPKKAGQAVKVADVKVSAGEAEITVSNLPTDFSPKYKIDGLEFTVENGKIVFKNAKKGKYTLTVFDKNNNYAEMTTTFILSADSAPASYNNDNENPAITKNADASDEDFADYIKNITSVSVNGKSYAASGRGAVKLVNENGSLQTDATPFAEGDSFEIVISSTGYPEVKFTYTKNTQEECKYVYAAMTWAEYWEAEGVQAAGDSSSSNELDTRNEADKGAFDAVTRATASHGLHRGSFQCVAIIEAENGKTYEVSHWSSDGKEITLTNGNVIKFNRGEITDTDGTITKLKDYEVTGLKYVPVKVASADYEAFCQKYNVVENGGELVGGYGENKLAAYSVKANVTEATNGLKTVTKDEKGNFNFSARQAGSDSGIEGQTLKTAPDATEAGLTVKDAKGSYGEFLRVDLTGNYGDLGANMQAVTWTYYGNDSTYSNVKATYGTKFAADNWMHKTKGIQLGLTKSLRCTLPEGTDGTGYWTITIAALGYKDVTYRFQATDANIVKDVEETVTTDALKKAIEAAEALTESDYTADSWAAMQAELQEAKDELKDPKTQATVDEATHHLNAAIEALVKKPSISVPTVKDVVLKDGENSVATTISDLNLPEDFDAEYTVEGADVEVQGNKLILKNVKKGTYTLTITDKSGKYDALSTTFEVYAETMPAAYNENSAAPGLVKAAGSTDAEFADFLKNITSVTVNGTAHPVSEGLIKGDGTLATDAAVFANGDSFEIVVTATGYKDLSFIYKKAAKEDPAKEINTASLEKAIQSAEALKEADYTADSWKVLQVALKNAKSALEAKKDQTSVDNAAASLNKAREALVKADGSAATPTPTTTPTTTPAASKNNTTTSGTGNKATTSSGSTSSSKTAKTGDPTNIFEMLGLAVASLGTGGFALKRRKRNKK